VFCEPALGDFAVVSAVVVTDHGDGRSVGVGVEQLLQEVAQHHGDILDADVVMQGAGGQVDRAVQGAAQVRARGQDSVPDPGGHPAGADAGQQVEVGFVFGQDDGSGGQGGDAVTDVRAGQVRSGQVMVGVAFGD
jgi:hypothetical protein